MFSLKLKTANAAFQEHEDCKAEEVSRILYEVATKIKNGYTDGACFDYNGNEVGTFKLT